MHWDWKTTDESRNNRRRLLISVARLVAFWTVALFSASGWLVTHAAELQKSPSPATETKDKPSAPVPIPPSEIVPRGEQALRALQEIRLQIAAETDLALNSIRKEISEFAEKSDRRWQSATAILRSLRSLQQMNDILRQWSLEQSQLDSWDRALATRSQTLTGREKEINQIYDTWQATGKQNALPSVALQKITEVMREANAARALVRNSIQNLLNLQIQLANRRDALAKIRNDIDKAREETGRELFVLDSLPLWEALFHPAARDIILAQAIESSQRFAEDLDEFVQKRSNRLIAHALFFLAIVLLFRFLRRGLTPESAERSGADSALFVLDRPIASSCLLSLTALPIFYPAAPVAIVRMAALPTVIPVIGLLPPLVPKRLRRWVYMLVAFYLLDFLRYLLPPAGLLARVLLLTIAAGGCIALGLYLRSGRPRLSSAIYRERLILFGLRLGCFLFGVSVVSNFVGNVTLAEILVGSPIRITYAAALIFVSAHLLMTLIAVALQSRSVRLLRSVRTHGELIAVRSRKLIRIMAIIVWAGVCLNILGLASDISAIGADFLELRWKLGAAEISIQDIAVFFAVIASAIVLSRMLRFVLTEEIFPRIALPRGVPGAVDVLSRYGIMLLGFFIALAAAGVDLSKVTLLISALGVGIGFGLQNVVNNFVSGLILVFEHPLQVGDSVEVGAIFGEVRKIGFRASVLRTPDGADVVIPNGELIGAKFINWSLSDRLRRISIAVNVAYGTEPNRVMEMLLEIARKHPAVLAQPEPLATFDRLGDSALNFTLFCWSLVDNWFLIRSELTVAINNSFKEAGIKIPFPQQDVHVQWIDQDTAAESSEPSTHPRPNQPQPSGLLTSHQLQAKASK